jgi:hypothetical protein
LEGGKLEKKLPPKYYDCPLLCIHDKEKPVDLTRRDHCEGCEAKDPDKFVRRVYKKYSAIWFGEDTDEFTFDRMNEFFRRVMKLRKLPRDEVTVKTARYVKEYDLEKMRFDETNQ